MSALQGRQFPRGICPACGRDTAIRADGQPRAHRPCLVPDDEPTERQAVNEDDRLQEVIAGTLLAATTDYGTGKAAPDVDLFVFYADAVLALPDITALRGTAEESEKRLDALIAVRRERDALRAVVQRVRELLDHMARDRSEDDGLREAIETGVLGFVWSTGDAAAVADAVLALPEVAELRAKAAAEAATPGGDQ